MRVIVDGVMNGRETRIEYNMLDRYDPVSRISSMSRTTGYTCTGTVEMLARELFRDKGVFPPELVGKDKSCFDFIIKYLAERGVHWRKS